MTYSVPGAAILQDDMLTRGVLLRRIIAWLIDLALLGAVAGMLVSSILAMGFLTLGLAWTALPLVPMLPALYGILMVASPMQATIGQAVKGLVVVRDIDLGPPTLAQSIVCTLIYLATMAVGVVWVAIALVTTRRRTLHDLLSGLVVVRRRAFNALSTPPGWNATGPGYYGRP